MIRKLVLFFIIALFALFVGISLLSKTGQINSQSNNRQETKVIRVIDGDTIVIANGMHLRLIGIDTPESVHPDKSRNTEAGKTASAFTKAKIEGKTVYLEKDVSETDKYGRLLRYVYLKDGTFFNEFLVKEGMATPATFPPDVKYADIFIKAQQYAIANKKGLWVLGVFSTTKPVPMTNTMNKGSKQYMDSKGRGLIKGNINSKGDKIYHLPGGENYDNTIAEEFFKTEEEAAAAGYRRSKK